MSLLSKDKFGSWYGIPAFVLHKPISYVLSGFLILDLSFDAIVPITLLVLLSIIFPT